MAVLVMVAFGAHQNALLVLLDRRVLLARLLVHHLPRCLFADVEELPDLVFLGRSGWVGFTNGCLRQLHDGFSRMACAIFPNVFLKI